MRIEVKVYREAEAEYRAWRERNAQPPTGNPEVARILETELLGELERRLGVPAGAELQAGVRPATYLWRFNSNTWVKYTVHVTRGRLFGSTMKIVILSLSDRPPA